jgi:hypothetical protein
MEYPHPNDPGGGHQVPGRRHCLPRHPGRLGRLAALAELSQRGVQVAAGADAELVVAPLELVSAREEVRNVMECWPAF